MATERMPITPKVLTWAREHAGFKLDDAKKKFPKIAEWESGMAAPTYGQLEGLSDKFKVPVAVFFFPEPPKLPPVEETFRTLEPAQLDEIPPRIRLLLRKARAFQIGLDELNQGRNPAERLITRGLSFRLTDPVESIAVQARGYLGVSFEEQFKWQDDDSALKAWRKALLDVGVYVFKDAFGKEQSDYSGFSLYDSEFPIIYVNNSTAKTRQIFTLFHELAHLLFRTSGVDTLQDDFIDSLAHDKRQIEIICNRLAACILMPEDVFDQELAKRPHSESSEDKAAKLAQRFNVSREAIYRRFLERGLITDIEYQHKANKWAEQGKAGGGGGDYYNTQIAYRGREYISLAFQRYYQNWISYDQLGDYLDIKPKNLTRLEETLLESNS